MPLLLLLLIAPPVARDRLAHDIVERAIKAHGGAALAQAPRFRRNDAGLLHIAGKDLKVTRAVLADLPDRLLNEVVVDGKVRTRLAIDGAAGHQSDGGPATTMLAPRLREVREEAYVAWLATLLPLRHPEVTLTYRKEGGVLASRRGMPDVLLWFSRETGRLERLGYLGVEGEVEILLSGHTEVSGAWLPTKEAVKVNGQPRATWTQGKPVFEKSLDRGLFARP
jgi:hypothetical protein